jgi:hypothetical protein
MKKAEGVLDFDGKQLALLKEGSIKRLSRSAFDPVKFLNFDLDISGYENRDVDDDE